MNAAEKTLALVIRSLPYARRSARAELDVALAAAALEWPLHLYFLGAAVLQLVPEREPGPVRLPAGYRAWSGLPELTDVRAFAEPAWLARLARQPAPLLLLPEPLDAAAMREHWRGCAAVSVW